MYIKKLKIYYGEMGMIVNDEIENLLCRLGKDCEWKMEIYYWDLVRIVNGIMKN